jgi:glycine oxidase
MPAKEAAMSSVSRSAKPAIAIVGAGVAGLGIGWRLAAAGCRVAVFDRGEAGRGASWAAAGMIAGLNEAEPGEEASEAFHQRSQAMWPAFAQELERAAGASVDYRDEGTLSVAFGRDDLERLRFVYDFQRGRGLEVEWLSAVEAREREPFLHPNLRGAILVKADHQVDNRKVATALKQLLLRAGGTLHEHTPVERVDVAGGRATGVELADRYHVADIVIVAAGAWSGQLPGVPDAARPPVRPVKGQMLSLRMDPDAPLLRHVVRAPGAYLVPRRDGRLIVGATVEEKGFDADLTAGGVLALLQATWMALPGMQELPLDELWTGFRPGSPDDAPILGPTEVEGLILATGQYRNGILLLPLVIEAVSGYVVRGRLPEIAQPFTVARFRSESLTAESERFEKAIAS